jgi:peptidoglycan hydrolase-like protein with peptidoglycan-binding domain
MTKKQIQKALKNAGYYDGNVDGKMGPKTKTAIKEFQKSVGLKADGVAGRNTKEKLLKYLQ